MRPRLQSQSIQVRPLTDAAGFVAMQAWTARRFAEKAAELPLKRNQQNQRKTIPKTM